MDLGRVVVLCGPSGVGKSSVIKKARGHVPDLWLSVSATTRAPRTGEDHGVDYWFVTREEFLGMVRENELLEWAEYDGHLRGTPREPLHTRSAGGVPVALDVDVAGARQLRRSVPDARFLFLAPPDFATLERRLRARGTESSASLSWRLSRAAAEVEAQTEFDEVIVNHDIESSARLLAEAFGLR